MVWLSSHALARNLINLFLNPIFYQSIVYVFGLAIFKINSSSSFSALSQRNIELITNWTSNNLSSTLVRRLLRRGQSVKYLLDDDVIEYINKHNLYR